MFELMEVRASEELLKIYFNQIFRQQLSGNLWGMRLDVERMNQTYPDQLSKLNFSEISAKELFSFVEIRSSLGMRQYEYPSKFYILVEQGFVFSQLSAQITEFPCLYTSQCGGNKKYMGLEHCNSVFLADLNTGKLLMDEYDEEYCCNPIFWERGEVYFDFLDTDTFLERNDDRVNGSWNNLCQIIDGKVNVVSIDDELNE